ncbi:MAG: MFS transporter [Fimbriiglobus sp.]|nr:MFS transporter [Fimbriiglobus sp.]
MSTTDSSPARRHLTLAEWGLVVILALINFTHILDFVIVMPLGERLMDELHVSPGEFGHIVSAYGIAAAVAGLVAATLVDRFDRKPVLLTAYGGFIVATLLCGVCLSDGWRAAVGEEAVYQSLLACRGLAGAFGGVAASLIMTVIGDVFPDHRRGKAIGAVTSAFAVASILGLPTGLILAQWFGLATPFFSIVGLSLVVFVIAFARLPSVRKHLTGDRPHPFVQFWAAVQSAKHWRSFAFTLTLVLGTFTIIPFIAPYMEANCGRSRTDIPVVYAVAGVCTLVGMNLIGWLADRYGKRPVFLVLAMGSILNTLAITNLAWLFPTAMSDPTFGLAWASLAATGFMVTASGRMVPGQAMMLWSANPKLRGAFTNLNSAVSHLATGIAPMISGAIITRDDPHSPLRNYEVAGLVAVGFAAVALGISFLLKPPARPALSTVG